MMKTTNIGRRKNYKHNVRRPNLTPKCKVTSRFRRSKCHSVVTLLCFFLFIWQMTSSLWKYKNHPVTTHVLINLKSETYLPSVTICNNHYRFVDTLMKLRDYERKTFSENELYDFWKTHGIRRKDVSTEISYDFMKQFNSSATGQLYVSRGEATNDTEIESPLGQCVDVTLTHQRILGFAVKIQDNKNLYQFRRYEKFKYYYNVYAHDKDMFYFRDNFLNTRAPQDMELWITYIKREYIRLDSPNDRCESVEHHSNCVYTCFQQKLNMRATCRIPSMTPELPSCTSWREVYTVYQEIFKLHATGEKFGCHCTRPCMIIEYKVNRIEQMPFAGDYSQMNIELDNRYDVTIREIYVYTISNLGNDLFAIMGFFLGVSLPQSMKVITKLTDCVVNLWRKLKKLVV